MSLFLSKLKMAQGGWGKKGLTKNPVFLPLTKTTKGNGLSVCFINEQRQAIKEMKVK
jgi:hypothetical protein